MDDLLACDICLGKFSQGEHDPLFLRCGHTFCRSCLIRISKESLPFLCPSCRQPQNNEDVSSLPINYKLLSIVTEASESKYETCKEHGDVLVYWCQTCDLPLCTLCIFSSHPQEHKVVKGNVHIMGKKRSLEIDAKKWKRTIETSIASNLNRVLNELFLWCFSEAKFSKTQNDIDGLITEITETIRSDALQAVELKMKSLMLECDNSGCKVETEGDTGLKMPVAEALDDSLWKKPFCCIVNNDGRRAALQWQDGKMFMSSFSDEPIDCDLIFQIPREIYLELSIKNECLGLVIIQPWHHLRRAQQFAALCQGTFGVSYKGSSFHSIRFKGEPGEYLFGGWYLSPQDDVPRCRNLLTDLEWGGITTGEFREGIVMGAGENVRGGESGFGICTREKRNGSLNCPMGEVVSGLEVVKRAVKHDPVTEIIISRCGVVVSNLMP